jgi:hypothetical protein
VPGRSPIIAASFLAFSGAGSYRRICRALFGSASEKNLGFRIDLLCGIRRYVALGMRFWLGRHTNGPNAT